MGIAPSNTSTCEILITCPLLSLPILHQSSFILLSLLIWTTVVLFYLVSNTNPSINFNLLRGQLPASLSEPLLSTTSPPSFKSTCSRYGLWNGVQNPPANIQGHPQTCSSQLLHIFHIIKMETNELLKTINAAECVSSLILVLLQLCIWVEYSEIFKNEYIL